MKVEDVKKVGVLGAGTMGSGIAQNENHCNIR
jgi:3-hydroxyacyl-CoA dehydrogenase